MSNQEEILNAYFAGLIDGEGNLNVYPACKGTKLRPVVKVNMTCEKTINRLQAHFGGSVCKKKVPEGRKPQWHWCVTYHKAIAVVQKIRPYLITKAESADRVLAVTDFKVDSAV
jgi:hypothetical protein